MYKKFSQQLYNENDKKAKEIAVEFLELEKGCILDVPLDEQKEMYKDWDFIIKHPIKIEVERKTVWKKTGCWEGYKTVDIPERKNKSKADVFIMVNNTFDTLVYIRMKDVLSSPVNYKTTINKSSGERTNNEPFFNVSLSKCNFYYNNNGHWCAISPGGKQI